ncbi:MAG: hypothetical protein K2Q22_18140, partial [Cytophagales bacterium]|nr:hypothetical protein [Cytophagales bacterium]
LFDAGFYPAYNHPVQVSTGDEAIFRSLEWSKNDFDMFKSGFFELLPKYSMENLIMLSQHFSTLKQDEGDTAQIIFYYFGQFKYLFILTLASLLAIFLSKYWYVSLISLSMAFISLGIWFYIGQDLILKARVIVPMLFFIQIYSIYSLSYNYKRFSLIDNPRVNRFIPYLLCLILFFSVLKIYQNDKNHVRPSISSYSKQYEWLEQHFPDQVKVVWGTSLSVDHISALSNFYANKKKAQLYLLLANLGYWQNPELLKVHGESDVYMALLNNPKFLLLLADYKLPHLEYLSKFYWENYKMRVRPVLVRSYFQPTTGKADFHVYKLVAHGQ